MLPFLLLQERLSWLLYPLKVVPLLLVEERSTLAASAVHGGPLNPVGQLHSILCDGCTDSGFCWNLHPSRSKHSYSRCRRLQLLLVLQILLQRRASTIDRHVPPPQRESPQQQAALLWGG